NSQAVIDEIQKNPEFS
ncbi:unnamed protein product, partial [Allacma fusca]